VLHFFLKKKKKTFVFKKHIVHLVLHYAFNHAMSLIFGS